jgi:glycogen(starch) synthase
MRICILTAEYPPVTSYSGGIGTQYAALAPALVAQGHQVHVITLADSAGSEPADDGVSVVQIRWPELRRLFAASGPLWAERARRAIDRVGPFDVVYAPEWGGLAGAYARRKKSGALITNLQTSLKQVLAIGLEVQDWRALQLQHAVQQRAERRQAQGSDAIAGCSAATLEWAERLWRLEGIVTGVVPNMVDVELIGRQAAAAPPELPGPGPIVAFAGRLEPRKGVDVLVTAMRAVWERIPDCQLVLAGRDDNNGGEWMSARLRRIAGERSPNVHLAGPLDRETLFPLLTAAEVVALPSRWEAFGLTALETLAIGRPLVASDVGGFRELVNDGIDGLLVAPADPSALAAALLRVLGDDTLARSLSAHARHRAKDFDIGPGTARHVAFFEQVTMDS